MTLEQFTCWGTGSVIKGHKHKQFFPTEYKLYA